MKRIKSFKILKHFLSTVLVAALIVTLFPDLNCVSKAGNANELDKYISGAKDGKMYVNETVVFKADSEDIKDIYKMLAEKDDDFKAAYLEGNPGNIDISWQKWYSDQWAGGGTSITVSTPKSVSISPANEGYEVGHKYRVRVRSAKFSNAELYSSEFVACANETAVKVLYKNSSTNIINIKTGESVPVSTTDYKIGGGSAYKFDSFGWWNTAKNRYYTDGESFESGALRLTLTIKTESSFNFPDKINVTFNGSTTEWTKMTDEYASSTTTKKYKLDMSVPSASSTEIEDDDVTVKYEDDEEEGNDYTGKAITPAITVKKGGITLTKDVDYDVFYANNINAGKGSITVSGKGNYSGSVSKNLNIFSRSINDVKVAVGTINDKTYTGSPITPSVNILYDGTKLVEGQDYFLNYSNNVNKGSDAKITIKGKGNFKGERYVYFNIVDVGSTDPDPEPEKSDFEKQVENATEVGDANYLKYEKGKATIYKTKLAAASKLKFSYTSTSAYNIDGFEIRIYDKTGNNLKTLTQKNVVKELRVYDYVTDVFVAGDYYISIVGTSTVNNTTGVKLSVIPDSQNTDPSGAQTVELPYTDKTIELKWYQATVDGSHIKQYFNLVVVDKAHYTIIGSKLSGGLSLKDASGNEVIQSTLIRRDEEMVLDKGTYLLEVYSRNDGDNTLSIKCRDFIDIKSISGTDYYEMYNGATLPISVAFEPATFESSIKWTSENEDAASFTNYDYNQKVTLEDPTKAFIYAKALGLYSGTITTSEGVSKTIKVMVKPRPVKVDEATANTTSKKKASLKLHWEASGNYYKIYEKSGNDFKLITETANNSITLKKTPGKSYNIMIEACYKVGNDIICSSKGEGVNVITAPYSVPKIKSAKQKGKTKYTKPYTKSYKHWNGRYYYWDTIKGGNSSTAEVKLTIKKAKGAKSYETGKGYTLRGNTVIYSYKGKIKGAKESIKIRGIWENAVTKAYGPWSNTKKIKIKGNK